jgi:hypothetical protein
VCVSECIYVCERVYLAGRVLVGNVTQSLIRSYPY